MSRCIGYLRDHGFERIEADPEAESRWIEHTQSLNRNRLVSNVSNWIEGSNIPGKPKGAFFYGAGFQAYRKLCDEVAAKGYEGFDLSSRDSGSS